MFVKNQVSQNETKFLFIYCNDVIIIMISIVAKIINVFATTLQTILLLASFTGKLIVSSVTWVLSVILGTFQSVLLFFQIVYEDNITLFTEEIPTSATGIIDAFIYQLIEVYDGVLDVYYIIYLKFKGAIAIVNWWVQTVFVALSEVLILLKTAVIFVGDTVWLIVTFLPVHLPHLLSAVFKYVGHVIVNIIIDAYWTLLKFTNYLTEVPLQSFMGITSAIIIVRLCIHFKDTIIINVTMLYWSILRNILYLYYVLFNYLTNSEVALITQMVGGQELTIREENHNSDVDAANAADSLCVICQERQKCVLTLPCRHVCLCIDCCRRLYGYQRTCPICRTFIYHTVTVYL